MDYYKILELDPVTATHEQISSSFRRLSLKNHPLKDQDNLSGKHLEFSKVCEAFDVLSKPERKAIFDKYGVTGLKNGVPNPKKPKVTIGAYTFSGNCFQIFEQFFGQSNPFSEQGEVTKKDYKDPDSPEDIVVELNCTIYEFYNGSLKTFTYFRDELMPDGRSVQKIEESLTVEVKPGFDVDTVLTYSSKGNQAYACTQSCLMVKFKLEASADQCYRRKGDDLIYLHSMTLEEALVSRPIHLKTLDGRSINVNLDVMITPQIVHVIKGEGMPKKSGSGKGDLQVMFNITFPMNFKQTYKNELIQVLQEIEEAA